jgi:hypothetical protein
MKSDYEKPGHFKERRSARHKVASEATLSQKPEYNVEVKVRDLSQCGFMAECSEPVLIGSFVSLQVPGIGTVEAQVRWQVGRRMGGMFLDPISLDSCEWVAVKSDREAA